jgi:hypothetical protein
MLAGLGLIPRHFCNLFVIVMHFYGRTSANQLQYALIYHTNFYNLSISLLFVLDGTKFGFQSQNDYDKRMQV